MSTKPIDLLNDLASGEDEFDVDLMAAGCRVRLPSVEEMSAEEIVRLYQFDATDLTAVLGTLVREGMVDGKSLVRVAEQIANGRIAG